MGILKSNGNIKKRRPRRKRMSLHLMNDNVNSFEYVITTLTSILPMCNTLHAEQIAHLVHNSGECEIYSGFPPEIYIMYAKIQKSGLNIRLKINKKSK
jgi:ATP-dependent Clp protease adapter protein ClpS